MGDDAENKYYPEYEAEISKIILLGDFDSDDNLGKLRQKKTIWWCNKMLGNFDSDDILGEIETENKPPGGVI